MPKMDKFAGITDKELRDELKRRGDEEKRKALQARKEHCVNVLNHVNGLLAVVEHTYSSCRDETACGHEGDCPRCFLLQAQAHNHMDPDYRMEVTFPSDPLPDPDNPERY